ncbi:hypothetical protein HNP84_006987 [Thermocatellispora tengchongensis]|uniref:Uncharacterized protein n=1 Tax=Thermocatellispora tengchongensis TaxID=1073253 RepID=A0A840PMG3_9ACTN|nr:hypothetical protein [Thermocatellispora tengchongensis]MBB5137235.1 hypothetical protein [Thermocatellispora tengchongensis]
MYGRDDGEWDRLAEAGETFLIERARLRRTTSYTELNAVLQSRTGLPGFDFGVQSGRSAMGHLLGLIVERNFPRTGLMISALVIYLDGNDAGSGFYKLAADRGLLTPNPSKQQREAFWVGQLNRLYSHYSPQGRAAR